MVSAMTEKEMELAVTNYTALVRSGDLSALSPRHRFQKRRHPASWGFPTPAATPSSACNTPGPAPFAIAPHPITAPIASSASTPSSSPAWPTSATRPSDCTLNPDMAAEDFQAFFEQVFAAEHQARQHRRRPFHYLADSARGPQG